MNKNIDPLGAEEEALKKIKTGRVLKEWFPAKEALISLEEMARLQERIYKDAADYGLVIKVNGSNSNWVFTGTDDETLEDRRTILRRALSELLESYTPKITTWGDEKQGGKEYKFWLPIEEDEGNEFGYHVNFTWNKDFRGLEFVTIDIKHTRKTEEEKTMNFKEQMKDILRESLGRDILQYTIDFVYEYDLAKQCRNELKMIPGILSVNGPWSTGLHNFISIHIDIPETLNKIKKIIDKYKVEGKKPVIAKL
jgi:hypothetical protein